MYFLSVGKVLRPLLQVIHMVTSAKGAEEFYTVDDNAARSEGLEEARMRDTKGLTHMTSLNIWIPTGILLFCTCTSLSNVCFRALRPLWTSCK